jgi:hypothetical protein
MKNGRKQRTERDMREEHDFSGGVVGKYAARYAGGTNVVLLDPDVACVFPDSKSVNTALRALAKIAERRVKTASSSSPEKSAGR